MSIFDDKTILLTGGTGSFGKKFTDIILKECDLKSLRIFSRGELLQSEMSNSVDDERIRFLIGDVRDRKRVFRAMNNVDIVVHAAALKHVPVCEYNPIEAVKTNISGAVNIIDAAIDNKVRHVMAISTDKAVHPVNLYGATKMVSEKLFIQANSYAGPGKTKFSCVRYGNVVGSRGSVIPLFKKQMVNGEITITDKRMTRFWITLEQGIRFVMKSIELMKGGEIFIPKIPSMRVTDLAEVIAPGVRQKEVGIRPGEKLHEVLLTEDESRHSLEYDNYYIIEPEHAFWGTASHPDGKIPPEGFRYTSDTNSRWLSKDELRVITDIP